MPTNEPVIEVGHGIWRVINSIFPSNTYICGTEDPNGCFLIDPGTDPEKIDNVLGSLKLVPQRIFCTHGHFDHVGSAAYFQDKYGASCYIHRADQQTLKKSNFLLMAFKIHFVMQNPQVEEVNDSIVLIGRRELRILSAPGHTPGSCLISWGQSLFTGDTLYAYGVGLSKLPGEDPKKLRASILEFWDRIPGKALIYPGHGEFATFAHIQKNNKPLLEFLGSLGATREEGRKC